MTQYAERRNTRTKNWILNVIIVTFLWLFSNVYKTAEIFNHISERVRVSVGVGVGVLAHVHAHTLLGNEFTISHMLVRHLAPG